MSKKFFLTTPLYYVNGVPHVGHAYTSIIADAIARYKRFCGAEVCALTGTDEHGLKIERTAKEQGLEPKAVTDRYAASFQKAWKDLGINFDEFIRTTQKRHSKAVTEIFRRINENGHVYLGEYRGNYCVSCEAYASDADEVCPDCGRKTEAMTEESYFFRLSAFQSKLIQFYESNPEFVTPQTRMNEIVSFVKGGLRDISISRTSFNWGIRFPDDEKHIFYVWFDALTGYISGIGFGQDDAQFQRHWPASVQLIGKDILRFHAVYWPAFLLAAGLEPPRRLLVNGWWTVNGEKMSKSRGNFIEVDELTAKLPADYIKYFLLREIPIGGDGDFSYEALAHRVNSDLANDIGNLSSRTLKMIENYFEGVIPEKGDLEKGDAALLRFSQETVALYKTNFDNLQINKALENIWELISSTNRYIVANEPWKLAQDHDKRDRLATVLYNAAEAVRIVALMLNPIVPDGAAEILRQLGIKTPLREARVADLQWGGTVAGTRLGTVEPVFPRIDPSELKTEKAPEPAAPAVAVSPTDPGSEQIDIDYFARVEMRVARILAAERIPKSSKLLKLQVDLGYEQRQIVAGIGAAYDPEALVGRLVAVVTNLKPARLMGVESNGMIVAASEGGRPVLTAFNEPVELGSRLR